ncbi:hypothetical protein E4U19_005292 [Claviceps sp. Clav32 group G5]|nr:hypothetical protein E4U19_005292 [Claviceps sp. Clav32 group G5]KAG6044536.1 hypothetical protein E4U39_003231 [Claviceps sp. Clav50 group G5]
MVDELRWFALKCILNSDETPVPFDSRVPRWFYLRDLRLEDRCRGRDKRQATLILYIFADGVQRLKPKLIFHRSPTGTIYEDEKAEYSEDVAVEFNLMAYNNEER